MIYKRAGICPKSQTYIEPSRVSFIRSHYMFSFAKLQKIVALVLLFKFSPFLRSPKRFIKKTAFYVIFSGLRSGILRCLYRLINLLWTCVGLLLLSNSLSHKSFWQVAFKSRVFLLWLLAGMNGSLIAQTDSTQRPGTNETLISQIWGGNCYATDAGFAFGFRYYSCASFPFSRHDELQEAALENIQMALDRPWPRCFLLRPVTLLAQRYRTLNTL